MQHPHPYFIRIGSHTAAKWALAPATPHRPVPAWRPSWQARAARRITVVVLALGLVACGTPAVRSTVYDFGPGATTARAYQRMAPLPTVLLAEVEASTALDTQAVLYRLLYADAQQLRPYAQARWSMPPAQLLRQRVRDLLGQQRSVLAPMDATAAGTLTLRLELEEFSQIFDTTQSSAGLVRVRATLGRSGSPAKPLAQTSLVARQASPSADAAGGVKALAQASDALILQLDSWLQQVAAAEAVSP